MRGHFPAVVLFVDTSGFTPLTARLTEHGLEGAEVLAEILLAVFEPLVAAVYRHGGFVAGFAGDAFKAIFPGQTQESYLHVLATAEAIRTHMADHPTHITRYGTFNFSVRLCIADRQVSWAIWSGKDDATVQSSGYTFAGPAIDEAIQGEDHAAGGELVLTHGVVAALHSLQPDVVISGTETKTDNRYILVEQITGALPAPQGIPEARIAVPANASRFYPPALLNMQTQGEFRPVYTVFLNVQSLPEPGAEDDFLPRFFQLLDQYGGYLCRIGRIGANDPGGTFLLFWGAPTSHETDLHRVLTFLLELRAQIDVALRAGVTYATVYAGFVGSPLREEYTCHGNSVNQAARQMGMAEWGQILLDAETAHRADDNFKIVPAGHYALKGLVNEQVLFALNERAGQRVEITHDTTFIGRSYELAQLAESLQPILHGRFGGFTLLCGEAGIGKSRLLNEVLNRLTQADTPQPPQTFFCQTDEILRESLNPFRYWLRHYFDQSTTANETNNKANFTAQLDRLIRATSATTLANELVRTRSFLGALVNLRWPASLYEQLEPQLRFENTLAALKTLILAESLRQPVLLVLEDAQWLDEDSHFFCVQLTRNIAEFPLAILATTRLSDDLNVFPPSLVTHEIQLQPLSATEITTLAQAQLGAPVAPAVNALLLERAEGNPFFAEQLLLYLREQALLVVDELGWQLSDARTVSKHGLPADLQTVLVARLDRLTQDVKEVVQYAAVLGREFSIQILSKMLRGDDALGNKVQSAQDAAIWNALTELRYLFRHALLRDAAYTMQLRSHLRELHTLAASAIETLHGAELSSFYSDLAYHYRAAEAAEQECIYVELAGAQAAEQFANEEALSYFQRALDLIPMTEYERRYQIHLARVDIYQVTGQIALQRTEIEALQKLAEVLADDAKRAEVAMCWAAYAELRANYAKTITAVQQAITLAPTEQQLQARAYAQWGVALANQGHYAAAQTELTHALTIARTGQLQWEEANCLYQLGMIWHYQGNYPAAHDDLAAALMIFRQLNDLIETGRVLDALGTVANKLNDYAEKRYFEEALEMWRKAGYLQGQGKIYSGLGNVALAAGSYDEATHYYEQTLQIARDTEDRLLAGKMHFCLGIVGQRTGNYDDATERLQEALTIYRAIGFRQGEGAALSGLGNVYLNQEKLESARTHLEQAIQIGDELNNQAELGDRLTTLGFILFQQGELAAAKAACHRSLAIRSELGQESLALVPHVYLASIAIAMGDHSEAQSLIDKVLAALEEQAVDRIYDPPRFYLGCYQVLLALQDRRATKTLTLAYNLLQERAARFPDTADRRTYLENIPDHRAIVQEYAQTIAR